MKPAFIEQGGVDLRRGAILKTLLMQARQHRGLFAVGERSWGMPPSFF